MAIAITIQNRQRTRRINAPLLRRITQHLLDNELALASAEFGVCLLGDAEMTQLNQAHLQHGGSTDVITFDYSGPGTPKHGLASIQGEICVCVDEAIRQSERFKTGWQSEVVRYVVHGVLHLLGHDDKHAKQRQKMKRVEDRLVALLAARFDFARIARS